MKTHKSQTFWIRIHNSEMYFQKVKWKKLWKKTYFFADIWSLSATDENKEDPNPDP